MRAVKCVFDGERNGYFVPGRVYLVGDGGALISETGCHYDKKWAERWSADERPIELLENKWGYRFEEAPMMDALESGDILCTRNGNKYVVIKNRAGMGFFRQNGYMTPDAYDHKTLRHSGGDNNWDIVQVYRPSDKSTNPFDNLTVISQGNFHQIWTEPRRMTLADVCDVLG